MEVAAAVAAAVHRLRRRLLLDSWNLTQPALQSIFSSGWPAETHATAAQSCFFSGALRASLS